MSFQTYQQPFEGTEPIPIIAMNTAMMCICQFGDSVNELQQHSFASLQRPIKLPSSVKKALQKKSVSCKAEY